MPKRIKFHVIYATSEVADHPASELGWAGPASRGWRSSPGTRAPHEIVLQLETRVAITRVQLLAHQYLIPKRIELLIHDASNDSAPRTPSSPQYEPIGWVGLAEGNINGTTNEGDPSSTTARELRTASIPRRPARYLRLRFIETHPNERNTFNQVALMGINIFGFEISLDSNLTDADFQKLGDQPGTDTEVYSPYDDLAFVMYVDNDIADIIRQLEVKKQAAIIAERFEYARKLKNACNVLSSGGRVLGGLQLQKRIAAAAEQYERATRRRDAIIAGRARLAAAINLDALLETNGPCPQNDEYSAEEREFSLEMLTQPAQLTNESSFDVPSPPTISQTQSLRDSIINYRSVGHYESDNNYQSLPCHPNEALLKQIKRSSLISEAGISQSSSRERLHTPRVDSPSSYNQVKVQFNGFDDICERMSQHSVEMCEETCARNSKHIVTSTPKDKIDGNHLNGPICDDSSYFNSPANSVSPTNLHYNTDILRNGQGLPAGCSKPKIGTNSEVVVVKRRNRSAGPPVPAHHRSSYEAYDEKMVPALRHSHTNEFLRGYQEPEQHKTRPKIGERDRKLAALPILIFGEELVEKFYSKSFTEKEEGIKNLKDDLLTFDSKPPTGTAALSPNKTARAATFLLHRALRDPVFSVYSCAAELTRIFFTEFVPGRVMPAEISRCVERLIPELLTRSGDPAPRVHSLAMHSILSIADCPNVRSLNIIPVHLVRPLTAGTAPRLALSRLLMVEQLLLNHGIGPNSGLKTRAVAELGAGGLTHGQGAVRRAAERLLVAAYEKAPRIVRGQLPPDDSVTRRNLLYRHLFENFDRVDKRKHEGVTEGSGEVQFSKSLDYISQEASNKSMSFSMTMSQMPSSMTSSQMTSSISMSKSMTSSMYQPKSSLKKSSLKKCTPTVGFNGVKADTEFPGYNKLRLDSAVSPKHQPKPSTSQQNPRNYVLEKNWQNSIIQNGNYCTPEENDIKLKRIGDESLSCSNKSSVDSLNSITRTNTSNEALHSIYKRGIVARNLHSSIVFDTGMYSDGEDTSYVDDTMSKMKASSERSSSNRDLANHGSPVASNKSKNNIYRSKSGSNVPTCFNDENYDSFDEGHIEIETYEYEKQNEYNELKNSGIGDLCHTNSSTPEIVEKASGGYEDDNQCAFCLQQISEVSLDIHYWRACPLLIKCPACRTPLEVRLLSQHLTRDCPRFGDYKHCPRCSEAVEMENFDRHIADEDCSEASEGFWRCPLCHENVPADEETWRSHLMKNGENPCVANTRMAKKS